MKTGRPAPWQKKNPKQRKKTSRKLSPAQKELAERRAKAAGRPYPNLIDNMYAARSSPKR